ncbi:MAG TPA: squalene--hopene cyclase [Candidatus Binatia bacterium]|nr:squalene--hopene cyclase [Candidatus Binatia bacterium]
MSEALVGRLDDAIARSQAWFLSQQHGAGYWHAPLEANVGMDAQYVVFNRFIGRRPEAIERRLVDHMLATQSDDGSWPLHRGGPGHLSTTIEAYFAMKLAGLGRDEPALRRARDFVLAHGGLARAGVFTRAMLAYFGQFPWWGLPAMPVELVLLPPWFPLNIYAMSSWARETVVPLTVLMAKRPQIALDDRLGVPELWLGKPKRNHLGFPRSPELATWRNFFLGLDATLKLLGRSPWKPLRARAIARARKWILSHQDRNGGWGGIQPPMLNCVMALRTLGHAEDEDAIRRGIRAIDDFLIECDGHLIHQPCVSPTWDTALGMKALLDSGVPADHPALLRAADWLVENQIFEPGDWSVYNRDLAPGGWAFEFANDWYPDVDDSAVILMVLQRIAAPPHARERLARAVAHGTTWTLGMQSRNGGYGAFDTDNDSEFLNQIPFADMEAMIDPPTEDLTGRVLELMGRSGIPASESRARAARDFLLRTQRPDGSWWGRWGSNFVYGTWSALSGLRAIGDAPEEPHLRRAVAWLESHQNGDGGFGETLESYADEALAGRGESTASQTAWGLMGLLAGAREVRPSAVRAAEYLVRTQAAEGRWREEPFTGTGFPRHFYLRYCGYSAYFPLMALGQLRAALARERGDADRAIGVRSGAALADADGAAA